VHTLIAYQQCHSKSDPELQAVPKAREAEVGVLGKVITEKHPRQEGRSTVLTMTACQQ